MRLARWIAGHPGLVGAGVVLATLAAIAGIVDPLTGAVRLRVDPALNEMLPDDDEGRRFYESLLERFGSDDSMLVALHTADVFVPEVLERVVALTADLEALPGVHHVESLANALQLRGVDGDLEITGFLDELPGDAAALGQRREELLSDPLWAGTLVSRDGRTTTLIVTFEEMTEQAFLEQELDRRVVELARAAGDGLDVWVAGTPHVKAEIARILVSELEAMVPAILGVMLVLSWAFFRSWLGTLVPVVATVAAIVWTLGVVAWTGHALNIVTTLVPPLVLVLGFAYGVHVVAAHRAHGRAGDDPRRRVAESLGAVAFPIVFTAFTTAAGFLSLMLNDLAVIRGFGIYSCVGVGCALAAALSVAPALLCLGGAAPAAPAVSSRVDRLFERLARFDVAHRPALLALGGLVLVGSVVLAGRIQVNTEVIGNFRPEADVRRSYEAINARLDGANTFYVMLEAQESGAFERPGNLAALADLEAWLEDQPEIGRAVSMVDYLKVIHRAFRGGAERELRLPDTRSLAAQLLLFGGNEELDKLVDPSRRTATIMVRSTSTSSQDFAELARRIDARLATLPPGLRGRATGNAILLTRASDAISRGQARSLLAASAMIGAILVLYFRSLRVGLLALLPNLLPVAIYFGALGLTGIPLNNATALMASIVLGIAVDDTIHLLVHYRGAAERLASPERAAVAALIAVGRPVTYTTVVLCLGLLVVATSDLRTQAQFGALGAFTLAVAWAADVTLTPALCSLLPLRTRRGATRRP